MQAAAGKSQTRANPLPRLHPSALRAVLLSREVLLVLQPQPRGSKVLEGEFPIGAALQPLS